MAAGNAGQEKAETPDDVGFVMGRIHTSGKIPAAGLDLDIDWTVAGSDGHDYSENELEIWFSAQDKIGVSLRDPAGRVYGPVEPLEFIENQRLIDGTFISIYNDLYHAANGANYIGIFLSPNFKAEKPIGIAAGEWIVRLHGRDIRDGRFDGWIERDDPMPLPPDPEQAKRWRFPSFFSERSNVDQSSISTLACGERVVAVANLDKARESHQHHEQPGADARGQEQTRHRCTRHRHRRRQWLLQPGGCLGGDDGHQHGESIRMRDGCVDACHAPRPHRGAAHRNHAALRQAARRQELRVGE